MKDQIQKALEYHMKKELECHPNLTNIHKYHLKRIGQLSTQLNDMK
ncbi:hypothetical protein M0R04_16255 [Candidatus Dojkabacteria bacterium]|jgi:hypothetical protein|nr:hypothetical protein [Candidatus Dojkabacteria bacterium]